MTTSTPAEVSLNTGDSEVRPVVRDVKVHNGPVARLLAKVNKWNEEYADYQMEAGIWRKLAL